MSFWGWSGHCSFSQKSFHWSSLVSWFNFVWFVKWVLSIHMAELLFQELEDVEGDDIASVLENFQVCDPNIPISSIFIKTLSELRFSVWNPWELEQRANPSRVLRLQNIHTWTRATLTLMDLVPCLSEGDQLSMLENFRKGEIECASVLLGFSHNHLITLKAILLGEEKRKEGGKKEEMKKILLPSFSSYQPSCSSSLQPNFFLFLVFQVFI